MSALEALANIDTGLLALEKAAQTLQGQIKQFGEEQKLRAEQKDEKVIGREGNGALKDGVDTGAEDKATIAQLNAQVKEANKRCKAAEASASRQETVAIEAREQLKAAEEGQRRAEEAAVRAKGEADHLVRSQAGQLNKAKAMNDAYRARYGKLDKGESANTSASTASSANASSLAPKVNQNGNDRPSLNRDVEGASQSSADVDCISGQSTAAWDAKSQALYGPTDASSTADDRSDTCQNPVSSFDTHSSGNQRAPNHKKPHRRGTRPNPFKHTSRPGEGLPANTPTGPKAQREGGNGGGVGDW